MPVNRTSRNRRVTRLTGAILCTVVLVSASVRGQGGFDGFLRRLARAAPELRAVAIEQYLNLAGPTPLVDGDTAVFLAQSDGDVVPRIIASQPDVEAVPVEEAVPGAMTRITGTDWYYLKVRLAPTTLVRYLVAYGDREELDPRNPRVVTLAGRTMSEFRMPGADPRPRPATARSDQLTWMHVPSTSD